MPGLSFLAHFSLSWLLVFGADPSPSDSLGAPDWRPFFTGETASRSDPLSPISLLSLPTGHYVLADSRLSRLFLLSDSGAVIDQLQGPSSAVVEWTSLGQRDGLSFLALDGPQGHIHQFDLQGNYLGLALDLNQVAQDEGLGSIDAHAMVVDEGGNIVVSDQLADRLLVFSSSWILTGVWGESGSGEGQFLSPGSIAAGDGQYLVADRGNSRWVLLDEWGSVLASLPSAEEPGSVVFLPGRFAAVVGNRVLHFDRDLNLLESRPLPTRTGCFGRSFGSGVLVVGPQGLYVGEGCSGDIFILAEHEEGGP